MRAREFISESKVPATNKPRNFVAKNAKMGGAGQHKDKKKAEKQGDVKHKKNALTSEAALSELSNKKLGDYKKAAAADASAADKTGDYSRGNKRFSGIVKATKKQFANDEKKHVEEESKDIPFAGRKVGQKEGPAGQLKGTDPKEYPMHKLVG